MKQWVLAGILLAVCLGVYWPHADTQFILDDQYTVLRNPLIKNSSLYYKIWSSRLFDASPSSGYIKFGYYRPVLQSSWILDYHVFALKASGYQWGNLLIHGTNCILLYILLFQLFGRWPLAFGAALLFCVLPTQEWVVRYITGRADELSALFGLASMVSLRWAVKTGLKRGYIYVLIFWLLAALTREVACSYILFGVLLLLRPQNINHFCLNWILIGLCPLLLLWPVIPKQGNILVFHLCYLASAGFCLWLAQKRPFIVGFWVVLFAAVSFYQGMFWTSEETLLKHTRILEGWDHTVVSQQLLMKYDEDIPAITQEAGRASAPMVKARWLRRLGVVYFYHHDALKAQQYFKEALVQDPADVDTLNAYAVVCLEKHQEALGLDLLRRSLAVNPAYPDTLRTLGVYYYRQKDFAKARFFLTRSLFFDPDNKQAKELLRM
jgi:tetratricopeptide (TPR) repeat protein